MVGERTSDGWELRLRPRGADRYATGAFLAFWLCGWAVGEFFALGALILGAYSLLTGKPMGHGREPLQIAPALMAGAFLLVWLSLWTLGGIAACSEMLRLLWGEDRLLVQAGRLSVTWKRGPFRSHRQFEREEIRRISVVGRDDRLALETSAGRVELSRQGTRDERVEAVEALRSELGLAGETAATTGIPKGWEEIITPEGERALVASLATRHTLARFVTVAAMLLAALTFFVARQSLERWDLMIAASILLVLTVGLAAGALWFARGRWEWRIGSGRLTLRKRYAGSVRDVFEGRRLMLDTSSDSDGDTSFVLYALADAEKPPKPAKVQWRPSQPRNSRVVARVMNDPTIARDLAAWIGRETGLELDDLTSPEARQAQLEELRGLLENSGPFGQWAAKMVDRLAERAKKSA